LIKKQTKHNGNVRTRPVRRILTTAENGVIRDSPHDQHDLDMPPVEVNSSFAFISDGATASQNAVKTSFGVKKLIG
jgi:hypothetical protein